MPNTDRLNRATEYTNPKPALTLEQLEDICRKFYPVMTPEYWETLPDIVRARMTFALVDKLDQAQMILAPLGYEIRKVGE